MHAIRTTRVISVHAEPLPIRDRIFVLNEPTARVSCSLRLLNHQEQVIDRNLQACLLPALALACPSP